ncbi:hypothetical protein AAFC00_005433 [Neodothiora populina]|uniref:AB hydrolase-1 domain-containing protein n=1 Tax=Neodothiora populina TaxID=2781224 RepID=A0ABR3PL46_9PEZI
MGPSLPGYLFIRACIFFLHWLTPLCILLYIGSVISRPHGIIIPRLLEAWLLAETLFYVLVFIPLRYHLQKPAVHPELPSREQRRELFNKCMANVPDIEAYLSKWFLHSPASEIKRENVKHFIRWAFLATEVPSETSDDEVEEYTLATEQALGKKLEPGWGKAECLRLTFDKVQMLHRSLFWYLLVFIVDSSTSVRMYMLNFHYHRAPLRRFLSVFPYRPHNVFAKNVSPSGTLTYWHSPHTSKTRLPILFIHGIGIGLYPYVTFLGELNEDCNRSSPADGGRVGIIAIEVMPVSFRITGPALDKSAMCAEINKILEAHGWNQFVLVSHSYGSVITTHLLHSPVLEKKIGPVVLIDPVTFLLHLPDVAYNFLRRKPVNSNEHRLDYFASKDIGVAHTLSRTFFWSENIIWKEDLGAHRNVTVVLSGRDLIVNTKHVGEYLTDANEASKQTGDWKSREWVGKGLDVLWFEDLDHAEVFDWTETRQPVIEVVLEYCGQKGEMKTKPDANGNGTTISPLDAPPELRRRMVN